MSLLQSLTRRSFSTTTTQLFSPTYSRKMKEAIVSAGPKVEIVDSPIPIPEPDQVVTKVMVSGSNPKDWKRPQWTGTSANQGDDIAGVVHSVGSNVVEFSRGDRVAAFHQMMAPGGSYAEYAVSWDHATFHIPKKTTFEGEQSSSTILTWHTMLIRVPRSRNHTVSCDDCGIWSVPTSRSSATVASYHYPDSRYHLRCGGSCWFLRDPARPTIQHPSIDLRCWKGHTTRGGND